MKKVAKLMKDDKEWGPADWAYILGGCLTLLFIAIWAMAQAFGVRK